MAAPNAARLAGRWCEMVLPLIGRALAQGATKYAAKQAAKQTAKETAEEAAEQAVPQAAKKATQYSPGMPGARRTGTRSARDTKEPTEYTPEMSGRLRYRQPREDEFFETRTPRMSDDYKKGGNVKGYAKGGSIDGCAKRGKTRGRMI